MVNLKLFNEHSDYEAYIGKKDAILPNVSYCLDAPNEVHYNPPHHDYSKDYLTFVALEDGTFKLSGNSVNYSLDDGETWTTLAANTNSPTIQSGDKIMFKAELTPTYNGIGTFSSTGSFIAQGNPMSLLYEDNFIGQNDLTGKDYAFSKIFSGCTGLTSAENMSLPATTLASSCYYNMFRGCTSLKTAPALPATTMADYCYQGMFKGCTGLTTAPALPATTLANNCYYNMFQGCTGLTTAPELPATTLANGCYSNMFYGCTSLNYIKCLATDISANNCTNGWVSNVAPTGTFTKAAGMTGWTTDVNGIPLGWTVQDKA